MMSKKEMNNVLVLNLTNRTKEFRLLKWKTDCFKDTFITCGYLKTNIPFISLKIFETKILWSTLLYYYQDLAVEPQNCLLLILIFSNYSPKAKRLSMNIYRVASLRDILEQKRWTNENYRPMFAEVIV